MQFSGNTYWREGHWKNSLLAPGSFTKEEREEILILSENEEEILYRDIHRKNLELELKEREMSLKEREIKTRVAEAEVRIMEAKARALELENQQRKD